MNDEQPTQPFTDAELSALRDYIERTNHVDNLKECTCYPTDPTTWTTYGSAVEPGSMYEPDPECPRHK